MRHLPLKFSHRWLSEIVESVSLMNPTADDYHNAKEIVLKYADQDITLFDAIIASISFSLKIPVWTYDSDFNILGTDVWHN